LEKDEQTEQDETEMYLRTSTEEELIPSMEEEYNEDEPSRKTLKKENGRPNFPIQPKKKKTHYS
jgi:hypothetical protein